MFSKPSSVWWRMVARETVNKYFIYERMSRIIKIAAEHILQPCLATTLGGFRPCTNSLITDVGK